MIKLRGRLYPPLIWVPMPKTKLTPKKTETPELTAEHTKQRKANMLKALESAMGIVTTAAKAANVSRCQHYNWIKEDEEYAQAVKDIFEMSLDFAESKLLQAIKRDELQAIFYYLNNMGKRRGYNRPDHVQDDTTPEAVGFKWEKI